MAAIRLRGWIRQASPHADARESLPHSCSVDEKGSGPLHLSFFRPNGSKFLSPAQRAGFPVRQAMRPNGSPYLRAISHISRPFRPQILPQHIPGRWLFRPNGPSFLSPAQRAGYPVRQAMRPNGLRYLRAMSHISRPFRPQILPQHIPGRWPGLRNFGPLNLENGRPSLFNRRITSASSASKFEFLQAQRAVIPQPSPTGWVSSPSSHAAQRVAIPEGNVPHITSFQAANPPPTYPGPLARAEEFRPFGPGERQTKRHSSAEARPLHRPPVETLRRKSFFRSAHLP